MLQRWQAVDSTLSKLDRSWNQIPDLSFLRQTSYLLSQVEILISIQENVAYEIEKSTRCVEWASLKLGQKVRKRINQKELRPTHFKYCISLR